jgi:hypothetical protein
MLAGMVISRRCQKRTVKRLTLYLDCELIAPGMEAPLGRMGDPEPGKTTGQNTANHPANPIRVRVGIGDITGILCLVTNFVRVSRRIPEAWA